MRGDYPFHADCQFCGRQFRYGNRIYDGSHLPAYNLTLCKICKDGNWDGVGSAYEQKLIDHLKMERIPIPRRNEKGFLPLPP